MPKAPKLLPYLLAALAFVFGALMYVENRRQNAQLADVLSQQPSADGRKQTDPYISGPVKNRILKGYPDLHACYRTYLETKPERQAGKMRVDWQIDTSGKAISPEVITSEFRNPAFEQCVTGKINAWSFPEPPVKKYVEHTFVFDEQGKAANKPQPKK